LDAETLGPWAHEIDGCDVVVNLAGRSVNCRYSARHRAEIFESRVRSTRIVDQAIAHAARPPRVWLQASTATIYTHRYDAKNDEFLRTETELVLKSRRVVPGRLIRNGFVFQYPFWVDAARDLCRRTSPRVEKAA
jgi:NAD dependent epimerase/dehydratase family enzyme